MTHAFTPSACVTCALQEPPLAQEVLGSWLVFPAGVFSTGRPGDADSATGDEAKG